MLLPVIYQRHETGLDPFLVHARSREYFRSGTNPIHFVTNELLAAVRMNERMNESFIMNHPL